MYLYENYFDRPFDKQDGCMWPLQLICINFDSAKFNVSCPLLISEQWNSFQVDLNLFHCVYLFLIRIVWYYWCWNLSTMHDSSLQGFSWCAWIHHRDLESPAVALFPRMHPFRKCILSHRCMHSFALCIAFQQISISSLSFSKLYIDVVWSATFRFQTDFQQILSKTLIMINVFVVRVCFQISIKWRASSPW